jgi:hypothetical protein
VSDACSRAGNVLVERIGDGTSTLSSNASQVSLVEYSATSGSLLFTSPSFSSGTYRLNDAGTTTSAGYFNIANGVIAVGGYDDSLGNSNILTNNNKVVNFFNSELSPTTQISFPGSGVLEDDNIRSVWPGPSGTFYAVGNGISGTSGVWYYNGSSFVRISSTSSSLRSVESFGGNLYYSTTSGTAGIYQVGTGLPSTTGITATRIITATSPTGFLLLDCDGNGTLERAYVADDLERQLLQAVRRQRQHQPCHLALGRHGHPWHLGLLHRRHRDPLRHHHGDGQQPPREGGRQQRQRQHGHAQQLHAALCGRFELRLPRRRAPPLLSGIRQEKGPASAAHRPFAVLEVCLAQ